MAVEGYVGNHTPPLRSGAYAIDTSDINGFIYVLVGYDNQTNAYLGDTSTSNALPVLCLRQDGRPVPPGISVDFYNGWAADEVRLTAPVTGVTLTSRATADTLCAQQFGAGFRMGEFHDGGGGWRWWASGTLSTSTRFWVAINDQPANPWGPVAGS